MRGGVRWTLATGERITEAVMLRRAAVTVDAGCTHPATALSEVWFGFPTPGERPFFATQMIAKCGDYLPTLAYARPAMAAAMRSRADFLDQPLTVCTCGHVYACHRTGPCDRTYGSPQCRQCPRLEQPAGPVDDDPERE